MNKLKELCKQFNDIIKYIPTYYSEQCEEFNKYSEIYKLINTIANLSSDSISKALDYTIKEIAYASIEPNFEIRKRYLREAIKDLVSGMNEIDVLLKYEDVLYRMKGWL